MKQPVKKSIKLKIKKKYQPKIKTQEQLDGSGLESFFRTEILDKLGVHYIQQFEAKNIGRFYDFYLPYHNVLLEIDGDYFHKNPMIYETPINAIQKRNMRVDEVKNKWALMNGYVLIRFWESDIRKNTSNVLKILSERLNLQTEVVLLAESKKNGTFYIKKKQ